MRMSCNGCRVLRKGCSENCSIKPCLDWIKSPDSQSNATLFLSKFYGRTGLVNLINAGPEHLRPAIFRSLLYEACGRLVNPVYGSVGLLWTENWQRCQAAVEAVLKGSPITQVPSSKLAFKASDIRHVSNNINSAGFTKRLFKVKPKSKAQFKRSAGKAQPKFGLMTEFSVDGPSSQVWESWLPCFVGDGGEGDSLAIESVDIDERVDKSGVGELDLTLGLN